MKILIVEDNSDLNLALYKGFKSKGYSVEKSFDGEEAIEKLNYYNYDAVILDINLPKKNGIEVAKEIRKNGNNTPIIALTAKDQINDKLKAFEIGFDDYLTKPFDFLELSARVESLIRRSKPNTDLILTVKNISLNPKNRTVKLDNNLIDLTKIEFSILEYLLRNKGLVVSNSDLIEHVWAEEPDLVDPPIRSHLKNLRRKIKDDKFEIIKTIVGIGYKIE